MVAGMRRKIGGMFGWILSLGNCIFGCRNQPVTGQQRGERVLGALQAIFNGPEESVRIGVAGPRISIEVKSPRYNGMKKQRRMDHFGALERTYLREDDAVNISRVQIDGTDGSEPAVIVTTQWP
jgi:hypothetical protein